VSLVDIRDNETAKLSVTFERMLCSIARARSFRRREVMGSAHLVISRGLSNMLALPALVFSGISDRQRGSRGHITKMQDKNGTRVEQKAQITVCKVDQCRAKTGSKLQSQGIFPDFSESSWIALCDRNCEIWPKQILTFCCCFWEVHLDYSCIYPPSPHRSIRPLSKVFAGASN
jgi:hypothetical protein